MRAVKVKSKTKKIRLAAVLILIFLLLLAVIAGYIFIPKKAAAYPVFSPMPMDTAGGNLIGNLPENLDAGGFMAGQNGWLYFSNLADGYKLYMCRQNGGDLTKITDFPVCNINILGTSLVFTSIDKFVFADVAASYDDKPYSPTIGDWYPDCVFGGRLYAIYGINSAAKPDFRAIDSETVYYSPYLDRDGLYVTYSSETPDSERPAMNVLANKLDNTEMVITRDGEYIFKKFSYGNMIYTELRAENRADSRIMRVDAKSLFPLDYIDKAVNLSRVDNSLVFFGANEGLACEINTNGEIKPVSSETVYDIRINQFGEISAGEDSGFVTISKEQWYRDGAQKLMSMRDGKPVTRQNGWYNYFYQPPRHKQDAIFFKANGEYFLLTEDGWSKKWLNVVLDSEPLAKREDFADESSFTPPWFDYGEHGEVIDPSSSEDFGSERPARPDNRPDATADPQNALDATVLLMLGNEDINDKYTGDSIDRLKSRYSGNLAAAVTSASDELANILRARLNADADSQEVRDAVLVWLNAATYRVESASTGEPHTAVTLSVSSAADLNMLYSALERELTRRTAESPGLREMSDDEQAAWVVDLLIEIMKEPVKYNLLSSYQTDGRISTSQLSDMWFVDEPDALIGCLIRGLYSESTLK